MKTVVTFADVLRDRPVVISVDWPEFVLLFNANDDIIRIRQRWTPAASSADFALQVKLNTKNPRLGWIVQAHPESPLSMWSTRWRLDSEELPSTRDMKPGDVLHFSFLPNSLCKGIGMMLHFEEETAEEEAVSNDEQPAHENPPKVMTLEELPEKIFKKILGLLDVETVMKTLPFVSTKMFRVAKAGGSWEELHFEMMGMSSANRNELVELVHERLTSLVLFLFSPRMGELEANLIDTHVTLFVKFKWSVLTELHLAYLSLTGVTLSLLKIGFEKGNFPALKTLVLGNGCWGNSLQWTDLEGWPVLGTVTSLEIRIGHPSHVEDGRKFWQQFVALEALSVHVDSDELWRGELFPDPGCPIAEVLPKLRNLRIVNVPENTGHFRKKLQMLAGPIQSLNLRRYRLNTGQVGRARPGIQGRWLFETFPDLQDLSMGDKVFLDWSSVPDWGLRNLTGIEVMVRRPAEIPTHKMVNLESACLDGEWIRDECLSAFSQSSTFKKLLRLPKLATVQIRSKPLLLPLIPSEGEPSPAILSLDLSGTKETYGCCLLGEDCLTSEFSALLSSWPKLASLRMPYMDVRRYTEKVVRLILETARNLRHLTVTMLVAEIEKLKPWLLQNSWDVAFDPTNSRGGYVFAVFRARGLGGVAGAPDDKVILV